MQKRKEFFKHFAYLKESKLQVQFSLATLLCVHLSSFQQFPLGQSSSINKSVLKIEHFNSEGIQSICTCLANDVEKIFKGRFLESRKKQYSF